MKKLLILAVLAVPAAASAQGLEETAALSQQSFGAILGGFRLGVGKPIAAPVPAKAVSLSAKTPAKAAPTATDLETLFVNGAKATEAELNGWFAGRRFTQTGAVAALLTGTEIYNDPNQGPIAGKTFKTIFFGGDKPVEGMPETYWDTPGSVALDNIASLIGEQGADWSRTDFTQDKSAVTRKGESAYEVRKNGDWLVARYPNGDYGYFFKKVR